LTSTGKGKSQLLKSKTVNWMQFSPDGEQLALITVKPWKAIRFLGYNRDSASPIKWIEASFFNRDSNPHTWSPDLANRLPFIGHKVGRKGAVIILCLEASWT